MLRVDLSAGKWFFIGGAAGFLTRLIRFFVAMLLTVSQKDFWQFDFACDSVAFWAGLAMVIAFRCKAPKEAMRHVFCFLFGMTVAYYLAVMLIDGIGTWQLHIMLLREKPQFAAEHNIAVRPICCYLRDHFQAMDCLYWIMFSVLGAIWCGLLKKWCHKRVVFWLFTLPPVLLCLFEAIFWAWGICYRLCMILMVVLLIWQILRQYQLLHHPAEP